MNVLTSVRFFKSLFILTVTATEIFTGCSPNKFDVEVTEPVTINVTRLDSAMFEPVPDSVIGNILDFYTQYPQLFDIYMRRIVRLGGVESRYYNDYLRLFLQNPDIRECYDSAKVIFGDFGQQKSEIEKAFGYIRFHIPGFRVPEVYTVISGFNESILMTDSVVAVSLDKFLGSGSYFYERVALQRYTRKRSNPELLPIEVVRNWALSEYENRDSIRNMASEMIFHGKILYLMDAAFPKSKDHYKISYTLRDIEWAKKNESNMWAFLIDKKLLFSTDSREIRKYVEDAPFVPAFREESPGRVGAWIGWQIVRGYMERNPDVTIQELFNITDHHHILIESGYSPY